MNLKISKPESTVVRIALVGCGRISKNHIRAICIHENKAELVALCDSNIENAKKTKELFIELKKDSNLINSKPLIFSNYDALLEAVKLKQMSVDLVILTTPSGLHPHQAKRAADAGLHVCTEKPMATKWEDGKSMVKACAENRVRLFVVKQNRLNKTLQLVKRQLDKHRFGKLIMVSVNVFWQRPQTYYSQDDWRGTCELDGGALMNQASHYVDLLHWLFGPVDTINASTATLGRNIEVEDTAVLNLRWKNGALGTMAVTMLTYPKNLEGSITILGEKGTVKIGGTAVNNIECWEFSDKSEDDNLIEDANYQTTSVYGFGHPPYYKNMLDTLLENKSPLCDGKEGLKSLELLIAAYRSARDGVTIQLPLD